MKKYPTRERALKLRCPRCKADPESPCIGRRGQDRIQVHQSRLDAVDMSRPSPLLTPSRKTSQSNFVPTRLVSPEEITAACSPKGGWRRRQLEEWGVPWPPPKGWRRRLEAGYEMAKSLE